MRVEGEEEGLRVEGEMSIVDRDQSPSICGAAVAALENDFATS